MRGHQSRVWIVVAVVVVCGSAWLHVNGQQPASKPTLTQWEYTIYPNTREGLIELKANFNKMGKDGWEYVGHQPAHQQTSGYSIFKRPVTAPLVAVP